MHPELGAVVAHQDLLLAVAVYVAGSKALRVLGDRSGRRGGDSVCVPLVENIDSLGLRHPAREMVGSKDYDVHPSVVVDVRRDGCLRPADKLNKTRRERRSGCG